tara:strand:- start:715 stop:858 length:144 start_codon:yes stop_codon:yes gene_type:complete
MYKKDLGYLHAGNNNIIFNDNKLNSGTYFYRISSLSSIGYGKFTLIK